MGHGVYFTAVHHAVRHVYSILLNFQLSIQAATMFVEVYKLLFICSLTQQPLIGPGPPHSRGF
jgi:hypothetical protein